MRTTQLVNKTGSAEQWTADVICWGKFHARVAVFTQAGVQTVRLREDTTTVAEWPSPKGLPWSVDTIADMIEAHYEGRQNGLIDHDNEEV